MRFSHIALIWLLAFIMAIYIAQGTYYETFVMLILLTPTAELALHLAGIKDSYGVGVSLTLLTYLLGITYYLGFMHSALDPVYLPITVSLIIIYAYSWWRIRRKR